MKILKFYRMALPFIFVLLVSAGPAWISHADDDNISMEFNNTPLSDVLKVLSQQSGINFMASSDIQAKKVNVYLDHVTAQDALESIVSANKMRYEKKSGNIYIIYPVEASAEKEKKEEPAVVLETRVYRLKYLRFSKSPVEVGGGDAIGKLVTGQQSGSSGGSSVSVESNSSYAGGSSTETTTQGGDSGDKTQKTKSKSNLMPDRGIDKLIASLLTENGKVAVDFDTNSLIVTDTSSKLDEIEDILYKIDVPPRQVMLEVYLLEVNKSVLGDQGLQWGGANGSLLSLSGDMRTTSWPFSESQFAQVSSLNVQNQQASTKIGPDTGINAGVVDATNFGFILHALINRTDTKVLARPRILSLNNEAANIRLVTDTVIGSSSTFIAAQSISESQQTAERRDVGVTLKITPQITANDSVTLYLEPSVSTVAASALFPGTYYDPTYRSVQAVASVENDHTLILAGLVNTNHAIEVQKIPVLGDLPLIGKAFRYEHKNNTDTELLVFITPHIVQGYDSLADNSATTNGKEWAADRMRKAFKSEEFENDANSVRDSITADEDKAMSQALGN